jgi:hypothetical protein
MKTNKRFSDYTNRFFENRNTCVDIRGDQVVDSYKKGVRDRKMLTDKRRIPLRSVSVRTPHLFHHGIPKVLVNPRSKGITSV